jgi:hypothetical protein
LKVEQSAPLRATVRFTARHAHFWEFDTVSRFWKRNGKATGRGPGANRFVPIIINYRARLHEALAALIPNKDLV